MSIQLLYCTLGCIRKVTMHIFSQFQSYGDLSLLNNLCCSANDQVTQKNMEILLVILHFGKGCLCAICLPSMSSYSRLYKLLKSISVSRDSP